MSEINFVKNFENNKTEQKILLNLLRAYAVAKKGNFSLPSVSILDEISGQLDISRQKAREIGDRFIQKFSRTPAFKLEMSKNIHLGMFNATAELDFLVNINNDILNAMEFEGFQEKNINGGYKIYPTNAIGYNKRFKKLFEYTNEYGLKTFSDEKPSNIQFKLKITKGNVTQGATVNIFHTGRIRFSGGYFTGGENDVRAPLRYISQQFFAIPDNIPFKINNSTAVLKMNARVKVVPVYAVFEAANGLSRFQNYDVSVKYEPEKFSIVKKNKKTSKFLYVTFTGRQKFTINLSKPGSITIEGATNVEEAIRVVKSFLEKLKNNGLLSEFKTENLNVSPKKSKFVRRVNMKPAPEVTRRGTSCPKDRRPNPYSFQGECSKPRHYVRPNPQGQPCCYKIPKSTKYIENKVGNRFNKANVKVPNKTRKLFGVGQNTNNKSNNVGRKNVNMNIYFNKSIGRNGVNPVGLKIGSRQCLRFSKVALVDIARRKGIQLPKKITKPILCDLLSKYAIEVNSNNPMPRLRNNKVVMGDRLCDTYKKSTLTRYARALGIQVNKEMSKNDICEKIRKSLKSPSPPKRKLPENLQRNIKAGKTILRKTKKKTPTPNKPGPSKKRWGNTPSPSPNNENFSNLMNFAKRLRAL